MSDSTEQIVTIEQASSAIRQLKPEPVELFGRQVEVGFLTWDEFDKFAGVLKAVAENGDKSGFSLLRDAKPLVNELCLLTCNGVTAAELGTLPLMQLWDLIVVIARVNWQVNLNDFFTGETGLTQVVSLLAAYSTGPSENSLPDMSSDT